MQFLPHIWCRRRRQPVFGRVPVYFTMDYGQYQDFTEGAIINTGNTFDLVSRGDNFFAVETQQGEMYTKKGSFTLDANGQLVTMEGQPVLSENNEPFFFAPGEKIFLSQLMVM